MRLTRRKGQSGKKARRGPRPRVAVLIYVLLVFLICGIAAVRYLRAPRVPPPPERSVPERVEARVLEVLVEYGAGDVRSFPLRYGGGTRRIDVALPDSISLTRLNLALTESIEDLSAEIVERSLVERGHALKMRVSHEGQHFLELRARIRRPEASLGSRPELPKVAILIDDLGHNQRAMVRDFIGLDHRLTFGVLPGRPHSVALARLCFETGREVIVHQPMEPISGLAPGPFAVMTEMSGARIRDLIHCNLARVPCAVGLNNHMGSKATADTRVMTAVIDAVAEAGGLYFVDSATTPHSSVRRIAEEHDLPCSVASVFIDAVDEPGAIAQGLSQLGRMAARRGHAIGIGHPRPHTYEVLATRLGEMEGDVWNLVPASVVLGLERI